MRQRFTWTLPRLTAELGDRTPIMGIPNVTPDSFSDGGQYFDVEPIAVGKGVRIRKLLMKRFGRGRWRKLKGLGRVRLPDGTVRAAELHWFEARGIGRKKMRIKRFLDM